MTGLLISVSVFLAAAVVAVPISKKLGLGSVLGYLIAGIVIGPVLGLAGDEAADIQHVAEFGVVMMLFLVGLELEPQKLWALRHKLLGLGGLQVLLTTLAVAGIGLALGMQWTFALAAGLVLSLSSTAIVLQTLGEKGLMQSQGGQSGFSVLLFQDIAVIPMLALIPLLALPELVQAVGGDAAHHDDKLLAGMAGWQRGLVTLGAIGFIVVAGHHLICPVFRLLAGLRLREIFTAFALLIVFGIAALMSVIDLSPALGTFLAGVVLANSEYRHELESTIEPFKGLLLGLFFITVGAGVDFALLSSALGQIVALTLGVIAVKMAVLYVLGMAFRLKGADRWLFALGLAQAGEFGFVLLSFTVQNAVLPQVFADKLLLVVALSMLFTPLLFILFDRLVVPRMCDVGQRADDTIEQVSEDGIIIAGMGRFGQMVSRLLENCGYRPTVIDLDVDAVEGFSKLGFRTYFGDASRPELLASAGIDQARLLVVAIDDRQRALDMVAHVRKLHPKLPIVARAFDRLHTYDLWQAGNGQHINIVREAFDSSLRAGKGAMEALGIPPDTAQQITELFFDRDREGVKIMAQVHDPGLPRFGNRKMIEISRKRHEETSRLIQDILSRKNLALKENIRSEKDQAF